MYLIPNSPFKKICHCDCKRRAETLFQNECLILFSSVLGILTLGLCWCALSERMKGDLWHLNGLRELPWYKTETQQRRRNGNRLVLLSLFLLRMTCWENLLEVSATQQSLGRIITSFFLRYMYNECDIPVWEY